jgi:hypothetical protein
MFDILRLSVPIAPKNLRIDPFKLIKPKSCTVYEAEQKIVINTMVYNASVKYHVLGAKPFTMINKTSENTICLVNYFGPHYVLFSDDSACMIKVPQPILHPDGDIILEPTFSTCDDHTDTKYTGFNFFQLSKYLINIKENSFLNFQYLKFFYGILNYTFRNKALACNKVHEYQ